jgi:hypothetical protein
MKLLIMQSGFYTGDLETCTVEIFGFLSTSSWFLKSSCTEWTFSFVLGDAVEVYAYFKSIFLYLTLLLAIASPHPSYTDKDA